MVIISYTCQSRRQEAEIIRKTPRYLLNFVKSESQRCKKKLFLYRIAFFFLLEVLSWSQCCSGFLSDVSSLGDAHLAEDGAQRGADRLQPAPDEAPEHLATDRAQGEA